MQTLFTGRELELKQLEDLFKRKNAALVVCRGRRRIGKSRLIQEFGKRAEQFIEFQGLPPRENITNTEQLNAFSVQFARQTGFPELHLEHWSQAFSLLDKAISNKRTIIFIDEISWMAQSDKDFAEKLKIAWDTEFKKHPNLVMVLCGSVSSWLEKNILNNTGFVGRISYDLKLEELNLNACNAFWGKNSHLISTFEKLKVLSITGGIPRYLEEIRPDMSAEENINRLCFNKEGILFSEFEHIFNSIFSRRSSMYKKILQSLIYGSRDLSEISKSMGTEKSGTLASYLDDLAEAGFIRKDASYNISNLKQQRFVKYSLKDNYTRFYLRYIEPKKEIINNALHPQTSLQNLTDWEVIRGFQFENLVLNNVQILLRLLDINRETIRFAAPYFQRKNKKQDACPIDLLIITKYSFYVCELKFRKQIDVSVIQEVEEKVKKLKIPKHFSIRPVLIYNGELSASINSEGYFFHCVNVDKFLV